MGKMEEDREVLACISAAPSSAKVLRAAMSMAGAMGRGCVALLVETPEIQRQESGSEERLQENMRMAQEMGARLRMVYGDDTASQIAEYARESGIRQIFVGKSNHRGSLWNPREDLASQLARLLPEAQIYIIPDDQPRYRKRRVPGRPEKISRAGLGRMAAVFLAATLLGDLFYKTGLGDSNIIMVYILGVLVTAIWTGGWFYSAVASLLGVLSFNFLFTTPRFTLHAYDAGYPVTFLIMLTVGIVTSSLAMKLKRQARISAQKAYRMEVLLETSQGLQKAEDEEEILHYTAQQLNKLLDREITFYGRDRDGRIRLLEGFPGEGAGKGQEGVEGRAMPEWREAAVRWVYENNRYAGYGTKALPDIPDMFLAVRGQKGVLAVVGMEAKGLPVPDSFEKNLLLTILEECGLAIRKERLAQEKQRAEVKARQESLRANLLRSISHDLRTPLTGILGNAGMLLENEELLGREKRGELYLDIYDDAMWLTNLVENLLSVTRIENGNMELHMEAELLEEVFGEARRHLDRRAGEHEISWALEDDLLMAKMDVRLIIQVLVNMVNNAVKYTPPGSHICLSARRAGGKIAVEIADDGPGIPEEDKAHLFEMFYTSGGRQADGRRGMGLGLALCRAIVTAHGGEIGMRDNLPHGSIFFFTLEAVEVNTDG